MLNPVLACTDITTCLIHGYRTSLLPCLLTSIKLCRTHSLCVEHQRVWGFQKSKELHSTFRTQAHSHTLMLNCNFNCNFNLWAIKTMAWQLLVIKSSSIFCTGWNTMAILFLNNNPIQTVPLSEPIQPASTSRQTIRVQGLFSGSFLSGVSSSLGSQRSAFLVLHPSDGEN